MSIPASAVIQSPSTPYPYRSKITGLYVLERNIMVLFKAGFKKIILALNDEERSFYESKISRHVPADLIELSSDREKSTEDSLLLNSNQFLQLHYFNDFEQYFRRSGKSWVSSNSTNSLHINTRNDIKTAVKMVIKTIIANTGGFISKKINKRISIPISRLVVKTRIHPNYLTVINIAVGVASSAFLIMSANSPESSRDAWFFMIVSGLLFQAASVFDGVDGEVAKYSFKFSVLGGWLDTLGDNLTLLLFLIAASYLNMVRMGGIVSTLSIAVMFASLAVFVGIMVRFIRTRTDSGSLVAFDTYFLQKLPAKDPFVVFSKTMKYVVKKEMFSIIFMAVCFTGRAEYALPGAAGVLFISALVIIYLFAKYRKDFPISRAS